jgi:ubiquinol-cytochrome c reductase cytochrome b subunit
VILRRTVRFVDSRTGAAPLLKKALRYVFPDHWSFLLGEIAMYSFIVLVGTGVFLTIFFEPSLAHTVYHGTYAPLDGQHMTKAYASTVDLSFRVKAGLLMRQTHHWAADVFVVAIVLHLFRVFFTGAFRKPRELVWYVGVAMLFAALLEGYLGYSLVDDLLSGMGLAIGYSVALSIPFVGGNLGLLLWGGPFPGLPQFESRMFIAHVLIFPILIGGLLTLHLALIVARHHTQFGGRSKTERRVTGLPTFPGYAPRSLGR